MLWGRPGASSDSDNTWDLWSDTCNTVYVCRSAGLRAGSDLPRAGCGVHTEARAVTFVVTEPQRGDHSAAPAVATQARRPCIKHLAHAGSLQGRAAMAQLLGGGLGPNPAGAPDWATVVKSAALGQQRSAGAAAQYFLTIA